ncbi:hypothetical protein EGJ57_07095 [Brucella anthropi]|nr:hypothetical protein EGJ57_07095 [Brucella anthropi]
MLMYPKVHSVPGRKHHHFRLVITRISNRLGHPTWPEPITPCLPVPSTCRSDPALLAESVRLD